MNFDRERQMKTAVSDQMGIQATAMSFSNGAADGQPQSHAAGFGGDIRLEHLICIQMHGAWAGIGDFDDNTAFILDRQIEANLVKG